MIIITEAYTFILGYVLLPVTPSKITTSYNGNNKEVTLVDGTIINKLNPPGLVEYKFDAVLPKDPEVPYANKQIDRLTGKIITYPQDYYLKYLHDIYANNKQVPFMIYRTKLGNGYDKGMASTLDVRGNGIVTSKPVTIEEYEVEEDADSNGMDMVVSLKLKEYIPYYTRTITLTDTTTDSSDSDKKGTATATTETERRDDKEVPATYTVQKGDCLINIAKKYYDDASKYKNIVELNNLPNANKIYIGQVLKLK